MKLVYLLLAIFAITGIAHAESNSHIYRGPKPTTYAGMSCDQCDEMFQECISEVDPSAPTGYAVCQLLWDHCKAQCKGQGTLTRRDTLAATALAKRTKGRSTKPVPFVQSR